MGRNCTSWTPVHLKQSLKRQCRRVFGSVNEGIHEIKNFVYNYNFTPRTPPKSSIVLRKIRMLFFVNVVAKFGCKFLDNFFGCQLFPIPSA